jgi:acetyl esterase/lipase
MKVYTIDLYDYFGVEKPTGGVGTLTCYVKDVTWEVNLERKQPAMLVIPGGGYGMVSDRENEPVALKYVSEGFCAFALKYSVAPVRFPYQLLEAVMAMNYIRLNAEEMNVDSNKVSAVGFSAGGHLCAHLGSYYDSQEVKSIFDKGICAKPNAVILSYPVITSGEKCHYGSFENLCGSENKDLIAKMSITNFVNQNSAPAFIWCTYEDGAVPVRNSILVADAYEKAGVPFSVHIWGKGVHGLSLANKTVYRKDGEGGYPLLDSATKSINKWVDLSIEWLDELGLYIDD